MLILGLILIVIGAIVGIPVLYTIGIILAVIGLIFWILGATGHAIGGRKHYY
jgi:fatty-acid desaturase